MTDTRGEPETPADHARHILYGVERCFRKSDDLSGWIGEMPWDDFMAGMTLLEHAVSDVAVLKAALAEVATGGHFEIHPPGAADDALPKAVVVPWDWYAEHAQGDS